MVKKKGGGDSGASKKTVQKKKQQVIEDKTFGLKNKNKSKKVQQHIQSVEKNVMNSGDPKLRKLEQERKAAKEAAKARKKAAEQEQAALFGEALMAVQKKSKSTNQGAGKIQAVGRDGNDPSGQQKKNTSRAMKMMFQMDAQEMNEKLREDPNYVPTLEDEIEMERQQMVKKLKDSGKAGTPVTPETFAAWQERKRKKRQEEAQKLVETELKKKKGGKGLSVLSGRALYEYKKELFEKVEDDDDDNDVNMKKPAASDDDDDGVNGVNGGDDDRLSNHNGHDRIGGMKPAPAAARATASVEEAAARVQSNLFLEGDDDDLDDLMDDDE